MMPANNKRLTSIGTCKIVCHQLAFEIQISRFIGINEPGRLGNDLRGSSGGDRGARVWSLSWEDPMMGNLLRGTYIMAVSYDRSIQRVDSLDIQLRGH
jgi:hypothetical protein